MNKPHYIATLTVNPAIDETVLLKKLVPGEVHRSHNVRFDVGGKGINVAACLADYGIKPVVTGFLGEENARIFENLFARCGIVDKFVRRAGPTRTNVKIVDETGTTDINLAGEPVSEPLNEALNKVLDGFSGKDWLIVMSGSLAPQMPTDYYVKQAEKYSKTGAMVIVDCSGASLQAVLSGKTMPYAIKPNEDELSEWAGRKLKTPAEILPVARELIKKGLKLVVVSMGAQGALFVDAKQAIHAALKAPSVESTVGAGDAMVAGMAAALHEGATLEQIARLSTAFAVGKLGQKGPTLPDRKVIEQLAIAVRCQFL